MTDDTNQRPPRDAAPIDVTRARDIDHWTTVLGVSEPILREAVSAAGPEPGQVRAYLGSGS